MTESSNSAGNRPTHIAYTVRDGKDRDGKPRAFWSRIGAAWAHKDLGGITIQGVLANDRPVVQAMTFIFAILLILGNLLTDIAYTIADPRVRLG